MPYGSSALSICKYIGSKSYQLKHLYNIFKWAECSTFIDSTVGMGSIPLNLPKDMFQNIVVNDKDSYIHNVWTHFIDDSLFVQLKDKIQATEHTLENYWIARNIYNRGYKSFSKLDIAWATIVSHRMSRNSMPNNMYQKAGRMRGGQNECINAWQSYQKKLDVIHEAAKPLELWNEDVCDIINITQDSKTLILIDPPYPIDTRVCKMYRTEMTDKKHKKMLGFCRESKAKIVICGRPNELYSYMLHDWSCHTRSINNNMSHRKGPARARTPECVWTNFEWIE